MRTSKRCRSLQIPLLLALLGAGCAIEAPYAGWPTAAPPAPPLWTRDVIQLLQSGTSEDAVLEQARELGFAARPTMIEIQALLKAGASARLVAMMQSAVFLEPTECPPLPTIEFPFTLWPLYPPLPGLLPIPCWLWLERREDGVPLPERIEP